MFTLDDMLAKLQCQDGVSHETFHFQDNIAMRGIEDVKNFFPDVKICDNANLLYVPFRMANSLPTVNGRGRFFTPKVMRNSFNTANQSLVDIEHVLIRNDNNSLRDNICGYITAVRLIDMPQAETASARDRFSGDFQWKSGDQLDQKPASMYALAALFMRHSKVPEIAKSHLSGKRSWKTSMECAHNFRGACFLYRGEFIPASSAPGSMLECVETASVKEYKSYPLAIGLGGVEGKVDYWGVALTTTPADESAEIIGIFSGRSREKEIASLEKSEGKIYQPIMLEISSKETEEKDHLLEKFADRIYAEIASISILGKTNDTEGHAHDILTDGTVLPSEGHTHSLLNWSIKPGTNPTFTARTSEQSQYTRDPSSGATNSRVHLHLVELNLRKKNSPEEVTSDQASFDSVLNEEVAMKFSDLTKSLDDCIQKLQKISSGNSESKATEIAGVQSEIASLRTQISKLEATDEIKAAVKAEIATMVIAGEIFTKADHDKTVAAAVAEVKTAHEEEDKKKKLIDDRILKVTELGVSPDADFPGMDGTTIRDYLTTKIPFDETGAPALSTAMELLRMRAEAEKAKLTPAEKVAETASKGAAKPGDVTKPAPKKSFLIVGSPATSSATPSAETASKGGDRESILSTGKKKLSTFGKK